MFLQDAPADTATYMILGFAVILGTIGLYVISLVVRMRSSRRDLAMLETVEPRLRE
jgi:hypothetical protein